VTSLATCSPECWREWIKNNPERKEKISAAFTGSKHPNWQGGAQMGNRGYRGPGWGGIRRKALALAGYMCKQCGISNADHLRNHGSSLEINHIRPFWQFQGDNEKANRQSNLEALCKSCHTKADWEFRKKCQIQHILAF
jgi:hypothetical protein